MGSLSAKNESEKFSRLGTFNAHRKLRMRRNKFKLNEFVVDFVLTYLKKIVLGLHLVALGEQSEVIFLVYH